MEDSSEIIEKYDVEVVFWVMLQNAILCVILKKKVLRKMLQGWYVFI